MLSTASDTPAVTPSGRLSYANIDKKVDGVSYDKFEVPNLIELQLESFHWFIDHGLRELFDEISPIQDFTGKVMELQLPGLRVRGAQVLRAGVPHPRPDLLQAALRGGRAAHQGDRRDPEPAGLHGRLPVHDRAGHVHHQRRRARRGQPARPLAGRLLHRRRGPGHRAASCSAPRSSRTAAPGSSSRPAHATSCTSRSTASASSRRPSCCAPSATRPTRRCVAPVHRDRHRPEHPYIASTLEKDSTNDPQRGAHRGLQEAAPRRPAHR